MWFIVDDQMADDRRIRRLPLATVGLWVKLCVIHSKGVSMQAKDPAAYPGHFDKLDLKDVGGTMKQLQQLVDSGLMEEHDGCLIFMDMDNLKQINDIYGRHEC